MIATEAADDHYGGPEGVAAVAATVPLGRLGTPSDVAGDPACFLVSPPRRLPLGCGRSKPTGAANGPRRFLRRPTPPPPLSRVCRAAKWRPGRPACSDSAS